MKSVWENINESDEGLIVKAAKTAYGAVKNKLVSIVTGNSAVAAVGGVLTILSFLPGIDKEKVDQKRKELADFMNNGVKDFDAFLEKVPLLTTLFEDEKECLKNILRFQVFVQ